MDGCQLTQFALKASRFRFFLQLGVGPFSFFIDGLRPSDLDENFSLGEPSSAVRADFSRSSSTSSAPLMGVSDETDPDLEQVKDLLTSASHPSFVFCKRLSVVRACLSDHGVDTNGLADEECEEALVCHLLNGLCARSVCVRERVPPACKSIAGNSTSCLALSVQIISTLLENVRDSSFKLQWLGVVCNSLGIRLESDRRKGRKKLFDALKPSVARRNC